MTTDDNAPPHGPWIDLHAHPGRFFNDGLAADDRAAAFPEVADVEHAQADATSAGMAAVPFATIGDNAVLGWLSPGRLGATREFEPGEAAADHDRQLAVARSLADRHSLPIVSTAADVESAHDEGRPCMLLTCEGADFAEDDLGQVERVRAAGARSIQVVHYRQNAFGDLQTAPARHHGLSEAGRELVHEINRQRLLIDVAHASFETTLAVLEESTEPVMLSHSHLGGGKREHPRLLTPDHARAVADAGGVIGAWPSGFASDTFDDYVNEIVRLVDLVGVDHLGIGTDLDGNYRPVLTRYVQFADVAVGLQQRGLTAAEADQVLGGNALRLLRTVCG